MLIDIQIKSYLGYDEKTKLNRAEFYIIDSEFGSVVVVGAGTCGDAGGSPGSGPGAVIAEYSKRKLNVAFNLIKFLSLCKQRHGCEIATQIGWWEKYQPLFTPELNAELEKLLVLLA